MAPQASGGVNSPLLRFAPEPTACVPRWSKNRRSRGDLPGFTSGRAERKPSIPITLPPTLSVGLFRFRDRNAALLFSAPFERFFARISSTIP